MERHRNMRPAGTRRNYKTTQSDAMLRHTQMEPSAEIGCVRLVDETKHIMKPSGCKMNAERKKHLRQSQTREEIKPMKLLKYFVECLVKMTQQK